MASVGEITVKINVDVSAFTKAMTTVSRSLAAVEANREIANASRYGSWNRYQMVGAR